MQLISSYAPPTFLKPCVAISTVYSEGMKETAVRFIEALNGNHALKCCYDNREIGRRSEWIKIKDHKSESAAAKFHIDLIKKIPNGASHDVWEKSIDEYLKIYNKFCPDNMKSII